MKKIKEIFNTPKVLWCLILGLVIGSLFTISFPVEWVLVPCVFAAAMVLWFSGTDIRGKRDWVSTCAVMIGGIFIWILTLL